MDFDPKLHQKVTYLGNDLNLKRHKLYVVIKEEYPNIYLMGPDDEVVIHITNNFNQVISNTSPALRNFQRVKRKDLSLEGDLFRPEEWDKRN